MSTKPEPEPCPRFCLCSVAQAKRAEAEKLWFETLARLPEAGNTQSGHGCEPWSSDAD